MGRSVPVKHVIEATDTKGSYWACWPREAGRPSDAALRRYIALGETAGEPVVWRARVVRQRDRAVVAEYRGPSFVVDVAA